MHFRLPPNLSYCTINGRQIFLDIDEDRYFRLSGSLAEAFHAYAILGAVSASGVAALIDNAILVPASGPDQQREQPEPPARSALELESSSRSPGVRDLLQVFRLVWRTRRDLATRALGDILDDLVGHRDDRPPRTGWQQNPEARALEVAGRFCKARLYVPIDTCCLLDSIALTTYLVDQGVTASIVFGVTDAPFSAHCWVQAADIVLNDTVGNTMAYTPIRTI